MLSVFFVNLPKLSRIEMVTRCLTGHFYKPYSEYHNLKYEFQILVQVAKSNLRPTIPSKTPKPLEKLIAQCACQNILST
jgi:hypothetical protein